MKEIEITKEAEVDLDYREYDVVKIKMCSEAYVCINRFLKKQFSDFETNSSNWSWHSGTHMFGFANIITICGFNNCLEIKGNKKPLISPFLSNDTYHFPIKSLRKILQKRKDREQKDKLNKNANSFSFDLFSSVIMEELRTVGFVNIERNKSEYANNIKAIIPNRCSFTIREIKLKSVIRTQQDLDETFPLELIIIGRTGYTTFRTTWAAVKGMLPGLKLI